MASLQKNGGIGVDENQIWEPRRRVQERTSAIRGVTRCEYQELSIRGKLHSAEPAATMSPAE
jgi:hypothetical protein